MTTTISSHDRRFIGTPMETQSGAEALRLANLDWTVENVKLDQFLEFEGRLNADRHQVALRSDGAIMGVNGKRHHVIQNAALAQLGDAIIRFQDSFRYVAGGESATGETTYLVLHSDKMVRFGGEDDRGFHSVMLVNDFNGNVPLAAIGFTTRFHCTNQIRGLIGGKQGSKRLVSVRHTASADWHVKAAEQTLIEYVREIDEIDHEIQRLLEIELQPAEARALVTKLAGQEPDDLGRAHTLWENRRDAIRAEWRAPWNEHIAHTALGVVMAAQGYDEHRSKCARGKRDQARTRRLITGDYPTMDRALALV